jgi:hypothetical protein
MPLYAESGPLFYVPESHMVPPGQHTEPQLEFTHPFSQRGSYEPLGQAVRSCP